MNIIEEQTFIDEHLLASVFCIPCHDKQANKM